MKYWYDTEFLEDGTTIAPISIGIVAEDGREYYAVFADMPTDRIAASPWLMANVVPHIPAIVRLKGGGLGVDLTAAELKPKWVIANEVRDFFLGNNELVELWGYYSSYDHVLLAQLFGRMIDLPKGLPMWTNDIQQEAFRLGITDQLPEQTEAAHNALNDARWTKRAWEFVNTYTRSI
jgi:hypothetical protein